MRGAPAHGEGPGGPWRGHTGPRSASRLPPRGTCPICVPHPGWDTRGLLGGCRIWPPVPAALYYQGNFGFHGRDESAAGHQNPKQPGAPASPGCARRVGGVPIRGLFIYFNAINVYFPPPALPKPPGSAGRSEALGCLGSASEPYPEEFGRQGMGREESDPDPSRSPTGAERGASRGLLPLLPPARRPGERGAAPRVPPDSSAAVEAPAGSSLSRVRKGQPCPPRRRPAGSWERAGALCRGVLTPASSSSSSPRAGGRLGAVLRAGGWVC